MPVVDRLVEMVRLEVAAVLVGVTEAEVKLHAASVGKPTHDKATAWPKLAFTDDTVTVAAGVV